MFRETTSHIVKRNAFDNVRSSFTKRQGMFPVILAMCFILMNLTKNWVLKMGSPPKRVPPNFKVFILGNMKCLRLANIKER